MRFDRKEFLAVFFIIISCTPFCGVLSHLKPLKNKTTVSTIKNVDYHYLINLDHRTDKHRESLKEFAPYGIVPYRFSAVSGWKLPIRTIWDVSLVFKKGMRPGGMGTVYRIDPIDGEEHISHEIIEEEGIPYLCHCSPRGMIGCILSHLTVMKDALESDYKVVWICEDDIEVTRDPHSLSKHIEDLDKAVGRQNWDLLYTFQDYRDNSGNYLIARGCNYRPNIDTRDQEKYNIDEPLTEDIHRVGSRFGTQSMIWTKQGIKKVLDFYEKHKIFMPYDLDLALIPGIKTYAVQKDVVTNKLNVGSDLGVDRSN